MLLAAKRGNLAAVSLLVEARSGLDVQNDAGGTALMWAALTGCASMFCGVWCACAVVLAGIGLET